MRGGCTASRQEAHSTARRGAARIGRASVAPTMMMMAAAPVRQRRPLLITAALLLLLAGAATCAAQQPATSSPKLQTQQGQAQQQPLVPLPLLLGSYKFRNAQLSPDAAFLAYLRPTGAGAAYNVFIKRLPPPGAAGAGAGAAEAPQALFEREGVAGDAQVTFDSARGVSDYAWSEDGRAILFMRDAGGDENDHLYLADVAGITAAAPSNATTAGAGAGGSSNGAGPNGTASGFKPQTYDLTPYPGVKAVGLVTSRRFPDRAYIAMNLRDRVRGACWVVCGRVEGNKRRNIYSCTRAAGHHPRPFQHAASRPLRSSDHHCRRRHCRRPRNNNTMNSQAVFDTYHVTLSTRRLELAAVNPGWATSWLFDYDFAIRGAKGYNNTDGSSFIVIRDDGPTDAAAAAAEAGGKGAAPSALVAAAKAGNWTHRQWIDASITRSDAGAWRRLVEWPFGEQGYAYRFNRRGDGLFVVSSTGR